MDNWRDPFSLAESGKRNAEAMRCPKCRFALGSTLDCAFCEDIREEWQRLESETTGPIGLSFESWAKLEQLEERDLRVSVE